VLTARILMMGIIKPIKILNWRDRHTDIGIKAITAL
jgi:hypothetical protein